MTTNEMVRNVTEASKDSMDIAGHIVNVADPAKITMEGATKHNRSLTNWPPWRLTSRELCPHVDISQNVKREKRKL